MSMFNLRKCRVGVVGLGYVGLPLAVEFGKQAGLHYIYAGNLPGMVGDQENTKCHNCGETLIKRRSYFVEEYSVSADGRCPSCKASIPGRWSPKFEGQIADRPFLPQRRSRLVTIVD